MTREHLLALRPGDVIKNKASGTLRVVANRPRRPSGRVIGIALVKVGSSWTDPNPCAWYDAWEIERSFEVTGRRRMLRLLRQVPLFFVSPKGLLSRTGVER